MRVLAVTILAGAVIAGMLVWYWCDLVPHSPPRFQVGDIRKGAYADVVYTRRITKVEWVAPPALFLVGGKGYWRYEETPVESTTTPGGLPSRSQSAKN